MRGRLFDAVLFDLDGVLCDSEPFIAAAASEALRRRYGLVLTTADFAPFVGAGDDRFIAGTAEAHGVTADLAIDKPLTYAIFLELIQGALQPIPGGAAFLAVLRSAGLRIALATGAAEPKLGGILAAIGIGADAFDAIVSADDVQRKKPDPETFLAAAAALGVEPARCLVVEDALHGVRAGVAAGAVVLGITSSQRATALLAAGASATAPDFTAVPAAILAGLGLDEDA
jgi:HAD superfamily hydrolase (TIGR01509 family)